MPSGTTINPADALLPPRKGARSAGRGQAAAGESLTPGEARFALEIVAGKTPEDAWGIAYSNMSLGAYQRRSNGNAMLRKERVRDRIRALQAPVIREALSAAEISFEKTFFENARIAFSDPRRLFDSSGQLLPVHQLDDDTAAAISSIEVRQILATGTDGEPQPVQVTKIRLWDKGSAVERFMRHFGAYSSEIDQQARSMITALAAVGNIDSTQLMMIRERLATIAQPRLAGQSASAGTANPAAES